MVVYVSFVVALAGEYFEADGALELLERAEQALLGALGDPGLVDAVHVAYVVVQQVAAGELLLAVRTFNRIVVLLSQVFLLHVEPVPLERYSVLEAKFTLEELWLPEMSLLVVLQPSLIQEHFRAQFTCEVIRRRRIRIRFDHLTLRMSPLQVTDQVD